MLGANTHYLIQTSQHPCKVWTILPIASEEINVQKVSCPTSHRLSQDSNPLFLTIQTCLNKYFWTLSLDTIFHQIFYFNHNVLSEAMKRPYKSCLILSFLQ